MDFVNLREKYILTFYETGNKLATSIMEKLKKKKNSLKQRESFYSPFLRSMCSLLPQSSSYYLKKNKNKNKNKQTILRIAIIF